MSSSTGFSGSYQPDDVTFLMQCVDQPLIDIATKELLIQSGRYHYSEMLGPEHSPSIEYLEEFDLAVHRNADRLAFDLLALAEAIHASRTGRIVLISLARAGTPMGVILRRLLIDRFGHDCRHFSVSIIAGRGIDEKALDHVRSMPGITDDSIVFVDGWTGKGVITQALSNALEHYNRTRKASVDPTLYVVADLCGVTPAAASSEDYLIPSCLLGATISGLVSRSFLNERTAHTGAFHGCRYYSELSAEDRSRTFVDTVYRIASRLPRGSSALLKRDLNSERHRSNQGLDALMNSRGCTSRSLVKPGLCEATRVLLRRIPGSLIVRSERDRDTWPLLLLAREKGVPWSIDENLPWRAVSLIASVSQ